MVIVLASGYVTMGAISLYKGDETAYKNYIMPIVHLLDPEKAHNLAVLASQYRLLPKSKYVDPDILVCKICKCLKY